ncbi:MAG TPA: hypothetical protein PKI03_09660, partial [Pseudomonadota bacterium]|nr:hypothetical protein [Pseudomonadota bacterium]
AVKQALDLLFSQVPAEQLSRFLAEVMRFGGQAAQPFLAAVVADRRTPRDIALELAQQVRPLAPSLPAPRKDASAGRPLGNPEQALERCRRYLQATQTAAATPRRTPPADAAERCFRSLRWRSEASFPSHSPRLWLRDAPTRLAWV